MLLPFLAPRSGTALLCIVIVKIKKAGCWKMIDRTVLQLRGRDLAGAAKLVQCWKMELVIAKEEAWKLQGWQLWESAEVLL